MVKKSLIIEEFTTLINKLKNDVISLKSNKNIQTTDKGKENGKENINTINFKIRNFQKVIKSLEEYEKEDIINSSEVKDLDGIGKGTLARIDEIIEKGILNESHQNLSIEEKNRIKAIEDLMTITGIGQVHAIDLYDKGITLEILLKEFNNLENITTKENITTNDIINDILKETQIELDNENKIKTIPKAKAKRGRKKKEETKLEETKLEEEIKEKEKEEIKEKEKFDINTLTHHQKVGLKYYYQFMKKIPRDIITSIDTRIQDLIKSYLNDNSNLNDDLKGIICGSYRRGCSSSGDIDLLLTGHQNFDLIDFVKYITDKGLIIDSLTENGTTKFMGVCHGGYRIDIRFVLKNSYGSALMYFTGSKLFNTMVRTEALKLGYTLEEYGLYPLVIDKDNKDTKDTKNKNKKVVNSHQHQKGDKIDCPDEETIFNILKIDKKYIDPRNRNITENNI